MNKYTLEQFKKFQKEIEAYERGEEIEIYSEHNKEWLCFPEHSFFTTMKYRIKPKPTREEITANWVKENDLKIGDKVKVIGSIDYEKHGIVKGGSNNTLGKTCEVVSIRLDSIYIKSSESKHFTFPVECLQKVIEEWIPFGVEDWDSFRDKWVKCTKKITDTTSIQRINGINIESRNLLIGATWTKIKTAFEEYTFEDGTPFGKVKTIIL